MISVAKVAGNQDCFGPSCSAKGGIGMYHPWQVFSVTLMVHQHRHMSNGKNKLQWDFQISKHHFISQREHLDNGLYDRFG